MGRALMAIAQVNIMSKPNAVTISGSMEASVSILIILSYVLHTKQRLNTRRRRTRFNILDCYSLSSSSSTDTPGWTL